MPKVELDKACKDKKHKIHSAAFAVVVHFRRLDNVPPEVAHQMRSELEQNAERHRISWANRSAVSGGRP